MGPWIHASYEILGETYHILEKTSQILEETYQILNGALVGPGALSFVVGPGTP